MSTLIKHFLFGDEFKPINNDSFTINYEHAPESEWTNDVTATNVVKLPEIQYRKLINHLNTLGVQRALPYDLKVGNSTFNFQADLTQGLVFEETQCEINIERFKSKDDVIRNIDSLTFEFLYQKGFISESDMIKIPYVIIPENQLEKLFMSSVMIYFVAQQIADSISTTAKLVGELIDAVTPDVVAPAGATVKVGTIIKYALLIILEIAKLIMLSIALTKLAQQFIELILPKLRYFKAMTFDKLLTKALANQGLTYSSTLTSEFRKFTVLPVPIDYQQKKWWDFLTNDDDRLINRGYPTSSDTVPTLRSLTDEICKIFNIKPVLRNNVLYLNPKGNPIATPPVIIPHNKVLQDIVEERFNVDCSQFWKTKIISYQNDLMDKMLFDNPRGLRVEYQAYTDDNSEWTKIRGYNRIDINFALGTIKKETKLEKKLKNICSKIDSFLGTGLLQKMKKRDGVLSLTQPQFAMTKLLYQVGGKQTTDYVQQLGAGALWNKYHYMDVPKNLCFRVYENMPMPINNEMFLAIVNEENIQLEDGGTVDVISCSYTPEDSTALTTYRFIDKNFANHIKTRKVYEE